MQELFTEFLPTEAWRVASAKINRWFVASAVGALGARLESAATLFRQDGVLFSAVYGPTWLATRAQKVLSRRADRGHVRLVKVGLCVYAVGVAVPVAYALYRRCVRPTGRAPAVEVVDAEDPAESLRLRECALRGMTSQARRGTRGNGIRILGGLAVVNSSLHEYAMLHGRGIDMSLGDIVVSEQLRMRLVGVTSREETWVVLRDGRGTRTVRYQPGQMPLAVATSLAMHAVSALAAGVAETESYLESVDRSSYSLMWRNHYRRMGQIGLTFNQRVRVWFGQQMANAGFSVARPPRA